MAQEPVGSSRVDNKITDFGLTHIQKNDCMSCHTMDAKFVAPSFEAISNRYKNKKSEITRLAEKIIRGRNGVCGTHPMIAHQQLIKNDATQIVKYILSLSNK